jgi:hypothetical protein
MKSKGVSEPRVFRAPFTPAFGENGQISGRAALRDLVFTSLKQKVPRPYSGAEDGAPSLTEARDDGLFVRFSH